MNWKKLLGLSAGIMIFTGCSTTNNVDSELSKEITIDRNLAQPQDVSQTSSYDISILSIQVREKLETLNEITIYTGEVYTELYSDLPSENKNYLLVAVDLDNAISQLDLLNFQIELNGQLYDRILDDEFLLVVIKHISFLEKFGIKLYYNILC